MRLYKKYKENLWGTVSPDLLERLLDKRGESGDYIEISFGLGGKVRVVKTPFGLLKYLARFPNVQRPIILP